MEKPKLRPLEVFPLEINGKKVICLRDPLRYGQDLLVAPALLEVIRHFNGSHTIRDIQMAIMRACGQLIYQELIEDVVQQLDDSLLLESDYFREVRRSIDRNFAHASVRPAAHAGTSYPRQITELEAQLEEFFLTGVGRPPYPSILTDGDTRLRAIIAPHIDLRCAGACYSWAYQALAQSASDCETVVILGTSHYGMEGFFILTEKSFETPLGRLESDREFIATLRQELGHKLAGDESAHRLEHSIEFQIVFLQMLFRQRKLPKIVPILVTSFQPLIDQVSSPQEDAEFVAFTNALKRTVAKWPRPLVFVIGADLAHMGPKFGDRFAVKSRLPEIQQADLAMLKHVADHDVEGFFHSIKSVNDRRRVCGFPPILTFLASVGKLQGKLLKYEQWHEEATQSVVTYASMAFYEKKIENTPLPS